MGKPVVPIVFSANDDYAMYCYVAIYTLVRNIKKDYRYAIYVFQTDISEENCKVLESFTSGNVCVKCIDISKYTANVYLEGSMHLSIETYYRLFIPCILPQYEKILYLDSDMCILSDVAALYECDLGGYAVGAVPDIPSKALKVHGKELGGLDFKKTFNAGVLLIDTRKFEERRIREKCLELLEEDYQRNKKRLFFADQDALNIVLYENYFVLDKRWNYQPMYLRWMDEIFEEFRQEYLERQKHAFIIHFSGVQKPWKHPEIPKADIFWKNAREIAEFDRLITCIMESSRADEEQIKCFEAFQFPYAQIPFRSKVVLYAAGTVGKAFYTQMKESKYADIVLWVDQNWGKVKKEFEVESVEKITDTVYDYLVIAIDRKTTAEKVRDMLIKMNVPENKIIWDEYWKRQNQ